MKRMLLLSAVALAMLFFYQLQSGATGTGGDSGGVEQRAATPVDAGGAEPVFKSISPRAAAALIEGNKELLIVDVRTPQERKQFRIADSLLVPVGDVMRGRFTPEVDRPLLVICAVGGRSYVAGRVMTARGYREVYNLEGGIESWRKAGLPLETGPEKGSSQ